MRQAKIVVTAFCVGLGFICAGLGFIGYTRQAEPTPTAISASELPSKQSIQAAVNFFVKFVRLGDGTVTVQGVRQTADGGAEADLLFNQFEYRLNPNDVQQRYNGAGVATISRYDDGIFL